MLRLDRRSRPSQTDFVRWDAATTPDRERTSTRCPDARQEVRWGVISSLLDTKFYAPKPRHGLVSRPHLTDRVQRGTQSKLTLVSAPAGFGKSTLLAEWLGVAPADGSVTAWLSLDPATTFPSRSGHT
jgi:hypothetical protein